MLRLWGWLAACDYVAALLILESVFGFTFSDIIKSVRHGLKSLFENNMNFILELRTTHYLFITK